MDEKNRLVSFIEYDPEGNSRLFVKLYYDRKRIALRTDSSSLSFEKATYYYNQDGNLSSKIVHRSRQMVFNEIPDTIPHTEWRLVVDTIRYAYKKNQSVVDEWEITSEDSTLVKSTLFDNKDRISEITYGSLKEKYFYTDFDSVARLERWSFTASSANTSNFATSDLKWRLLATINQYYDSLNRLIKRETFDEQIGESVRNELFEYDSMGKLTTIMNENDCTSIVYSLGDKE